MQEVVNINDLVTNPGEFQIRSDVQNLELYSDDYPFKLSLRIRNFTDESSYLKFVRNCEKLFRGSLEYKLWKDYILDVLQFNSCMITNEKMAEVSIEVHHHVPSLFILMKTLINECIETNTEFSTFDICLKAIEVHFTNKIGYACLVSSMHEKFTNGYLDIPLEIVKGNYREFLNQYSKYITEEDFDVINKRLAMNLENCKHIDWKKDEYPALEKISSGGL
jgi:hypothetical protein